MRLPLLPASERGAAFLLAVYFAALMLFVLGGVSLQRTTTDVRAAEISRDLSQSFWAAEGALDRMLYSLGRGSLEDSFDETGACATGDIADDRLAAAMGLTSAGGYSLCLASPPDEEPRLYSVDITGRIGNTQQRLSSIIAVRDAAVTFKDALYGQESVQTYGIITGAVDTGKNAGVATSNEPPAWVFDEETKRPKVTSGIMAEGNLATASTAPGAVQVMHGSYIAGDVKVGQGVEPKSVVTVESEGQGKSTILGKIDTIEGDLLDLPPVKAPAGAVPLGSLVLSGTSSSRALAAGTYTADSLYVANKATLTTKGPVSLYVTGSIRIDDAQVYGEPATPNDVCNPATQACLSPKNLRIFAQPAAGVAGDYLQISNRALVGAAIYAPAYRAVLHEYPLVIGSLIAKQVSAGHIKYSFLGRDGDEDEDATTLVLYDTDLGRQKVPVVQGEKMASLRMVRLDEIALGATGEEDEEVAEGSETLAVPKITAHQTYYGGGGGWGCSFGGFW
jgi:hypothetical protein